MNQKRSILMHSRWIPFCAILAILVVAVPIAGFTQGDPKRRDTIYVTNDYDKSVGITVWTERHEQVSRKSWNLAPGQRYWLADDGGKIRVVGSDTIRVGKGWGEVAIRDVGLHRNGTWQVKVRDIWRLTHPVH